MMERLRETLSDIGDSLWSPREGREPPAHFPPSIYLGVSVAIAVLLVLRRTDGVTNPQFWAEDGTVFFQQNLEPGCWPTLRTFFRGFPYLEQKLVACAATPVPFARVPLVYNAVAYLVAAACLASFSLPAFRHVIRSDVLRVVFCLAVAAVPHATELVGSLTNTSWYLGIWLLLLTIAQLPHAPLALAALAAAVLLATFSAPLVVLTAPLWLTRAIYAVRRRHLRDASFAAIAFGGVLALIAVTNDLGRGPAPIPPLAWPLLNNVSTRVLADAALGPAMVQRLGTQVGAGAVYTIALAMLVGLGMLAWRGQWRSLPVLVYCAYGIMTSSALALGGHPYLAGMATSVRSLLEWQPWFPARYHVLGVTLVYLALLAAVDRLPAWRRWPVATVVLVLVWLLATQARTFVLPPFHDLRWPEHAARLERKYADRSPDPVVIPVHPDRMGLVFHIALDGRAIRPTVGVPPSAILGSLLDGTTFDQSFVARCPNLSEIDLWFGREGDVARQTVDVQLREAETGRIEAAFVRDAGDLVVLVPDLATRAAMLEQRARSQGREVPREITEGFAKLDQVFAQALYFAPIPDSQGKRYLISVRAFGGAPGDSISVYGSTADTYPDGEARRDGEPIPGDLAFRYGCS